MNKFYCQQLVVIIKKSQKVLKNILSKFLYTNDIFFRVLVESNAKNQPQKVNSD